MTTIDRPPVRRGSNLPRVGDFNETVVLDAVRRATGGLSRVELAASTRLSAQTVSNICRRLIARGLLVETGKRSGTGGKPRVVLEVEPGSRYAVGVHLDPAAITYVVLDLAGTVVERLRRPTPAVVDQDATLEEMSLAVEAVLRSSGVPRDRVVGVGIAAPGPIDHTEGSVVDPPQLEGWHRVPVRDHVARTTGLPVVMDKDVVAAVVGERWAGVASGSTDLVFFYLGTGAGMGIVAGDLVVRGGSGNAGEIGGLDASCTTRAVVEEAIERGVLAPEVTPVGPRDAERRLAEVATLAGSGDEVATDVIDGWARRVGHGVGTAASLLDSDLIVFGGPMWPHLRDRFLAVVPPILDSWPYPALRRARLASSALGDDVGAIGAACLVLDQLLSPQPHTLLLS
ncbi:ROK family transcriptional regulator [Luteimicrobium sp. DT211]|uniref:ROK family transcriptional regulator n=1 Tax=Luteimicrobium sp. DT211 TaxID=3393412 RepID=UPI003CF4AFF0